MKLTRFMKLQDPQSLPKLSKQQTIAGQEETLWWSCLRAMRYSGDMAVMSPCPHWGEEFGDEAAFELL